MTDPIYAIARRPRRRWPWVLLILLLNLLAACQALVWRFESRLERTLAAYRGPSLRFAEQVPAPLKAGTPNGWEMVEDVLIRFEGAARAPVASGDPEPRKDPEVVAVRELLKNLEFTDERPGPEDLAQLRAVLARLGPTLALLDRPLLAVAEAHYPIDLEAVPWDFRLPNYVGVLRISGLLRARGEVAVAEGRFAAAADDVVRLYRLAGWSARATSSIVGTLIASAISHQADLLVASGLGRSGLDGAARARILGAARANDPRELMSRAIAFEWAAAYSTLTDPRMPEFVFGAKSSGDGKSSAWMAKIPGWRIWLLWNADILVRRYGAFWAAGEKPAYQRGPAMRELAEQEVSRYAILARTILDTSDDGFFDRRDLWVASADQLEIAFALEDFRERNGDFPDRLAELAIPGEPRIDLFSGEPYRYQPEETGYALYSVGYNREDDDGVRTFDEEGKIDFERGDWVWRVTS